MSMTAIDLTSFAERLDEIEMSREMQSDLRRAARLARQLAELLDSFPDTDAIKLPSTSPLERFAETVEQTAGEFLPGDLSAEYTNIALAVKATEALGVDLVDVDEAKTLLDRYSDLLRSRSNGNGQRSPSRAQGRVISMYCEGCGEHHTSFTGDWTSIRHHANVHARECDKANPDKDDLNEVRRAVYEGETPITRGGIRFDTAA